MKITHLILCVTALLTTMQLANARIYKWVDENGKTVYAEKPPVDRKNLVIERMEVRKVEEENSTAAQEKYLEDSKNFAERREKAQEDAKKAAEKAKEQKEISAYCVKIRSRLKSLQSKSKVLQTGTDGKTRVIDKNKRAAEIRKAQNNINKHCK